MKVEKTYLSRMQRKNERKPNYFAYKTKVASLLRPFPIIWIKLSCLFLLSKPTERITVQKRTIKMHECPISMLIVNQKGGGAQNFEFVLIMQVTENEMHSFLWSSEV